MIKAYNKIRHCVGELVRLPDGEYVALSEYFGDDYIPKGYILGSGETYCGRDPDLWVAIIDMEEIETEAAAEADYPEQPTNGQNFIINDGLANDTGQAVDG